MLMFQEYMTPIFAEALRVAKPGAHLLAFGGTRTYHRLACAIEDAGWEIRDCIMWVYESGFPKSMDVAKAIDKASGYEGEVIGSRIVDVGMQGGNMHAGRKQQQQQQQIRALSPEAAAWQGWGTCVKPAVEPIVVARKPLEGTVAANVLKYGTGAINIDGCRVPIGESWKHGATLTKPSGEFDGGWKRIEQQSNSLGRFPANLIHDGSDEVLALFPNNVKGGTWQRTDKARHFNNNGDATNCVCTGKDSSIGSAARFFYCAKASKKDRGEGNDHPTVKPNDLMRWLVRLVCPKGGVVLDPFMGSGSTGVACIDEGMRFVGIEREGHYCEIARGRIEDAGVRNAQGRLF
jgi:site-specific DNA-methyltransferase (adenine-specific)